MKSPIVMLTAALVVCLTGSAWALPAVSQDLRSPDTVTPAVPDLARGQDLRSPDTVTPAEPVAPAARSMQDLRAPDTVTSAEPAPAATSLAVTLPADGGLNVFLIVLISLGGASALGGAAYTVMRLAHHQPPVA
jgi:hypothetical protein